MTQAPDDQMENQAALSRDLYSRFQVEMKRWDTLGRFMPYAWGNLPDSMPGAAMAYRWMLDEAIRSIANSLNCLTLNTRRLAAWAYVLGPLTDEEKFHAVLEFVDPIAVNALNYPYVIRSRFIYAVAHLCHHANLICTPGHKDEFPDEEKIYLGVIGRIGRPWKKFSKLYGGLERLASTDYRDASQDFRNLYTHRIPPRIEVGYVSRVTRIPASELNRLIHEGGPDQTANPSHSGRWAYGVGEFAPLPLTKVVEILTDECTKAYLVFELFQHLVTEMNGRIINTLSCVEDSIGPRATVAND